MAVGIDVRMSRGRGEENDLRSFHRVVGWENETKGILLVLVYASGSSSNGYEPLVDSVRLGDGHARNRGILDGPFGKFSGKAALCDTGELFSAG